MATFLSTDFVIFALTATLYTFYHKMGGVLCSISGSTPTTTASTTCNANNGNEIKNSAFVFVKPHANTKAVQDLVRTKLIEAGCTILKEISIDGKTIDEQKLIDQHYYAIGTYIQHNINLIFYDSFRFICMKSVTF